MMNFEKWIEQNRPKKDYPSRESVCHFMEIARRNFKDSYVSGISDDAKFMFSYQAIMILAKVCMHAEGWRLGSTPGHHYKYIESFVYILDLPADRVDAIQRFRMKRNTCEYEQAYTVSLKEADAIQKVASELMEKVSEHMKIKHPDLY